MQEIEVYKGRRKKRIQPPSPSPHIWPLLLLTSWKDMQSLSKTLFPLGSTLHSPNTVSKSINFSFHISWQLNSQYCPRILFQSYLVLGSTVFENAHCFISIPLSIRFQAHILPRRRIFLLKSFNTAYVARVPILCASANMRCFQYL